MSTIGERRKKEKRKEQRIGKSKSIDSYAVGKFTSYATFLSKSESCRTSSFGEHSFAVLPRSQKRRNAPFFPLDAWRFFVIGRDGVYYLRMLPHLLETQSVMECCAKNYVRWNERKIRIYGVKWSTILKIDSVRMNTGLPQTWRTWKSQAGFKFWGGTWKVRENGPGTFFAMLQKSHILERS